GVVGVELEAEGPIRLLEPAGGAVDADARRDDAVRPARLPDGVPELGAFIHRNVELPTEIADVRYAGGEHVEPVDRDVLPRAERECLVRDVVDRDRCEHVARARAPETDRALRRGEVLDPRIADEVVRKPFLVSHAVRTARDDAKAVV